MDKSPQAVFDKVVAHLRQQGERSLDDAGDCAYRGCAGMMCAAGCLIPDADYTPEMENKTVPHLGYFQGLAPEVRTLVTRLQRIHDGEYPECWEGEFRALAEVEMLVYTAPATP